MSIDLEVVGHSWENPDGSTPDGSVTFVLSGQEDGSTESTTVGTRPIIASLVAGAISQQLVPNVNSDLSPSSSFYWVTEDIVGATPISYPITVPTGGPWDLWTLREES
jgi:hypothetical protein